MLGKVTVDEHQKCLGKVLYIKVIYRDISSIHLQTHY